MSNITGSSSNVDLQALVSNLQNSINNISGAFVSVQTNISNLQQYDQSATEKFTKNDVDDLQVKEEIEGLQEVDLLTNQRITLLESKFPITNVSINDNTISKSKIAGLVNDITDIYNKINSNTTNISTLDARELASTSTLTTNLNNLTALELQHYNQNYNEFHTLLASQPGTTTNTFQVQIDNITTDLSAEKVKTTSNTSNISQNTSSINVLNTKVSSLETDNENNKTNIASNTTKINNNTTNINTLNTNLSNLSNTVSLLSNTENTHYVNQQSYNLTTTSNISALDTRETTHYNELSTKYNTLQTSGTSNYTELNNKIELLDTREATNNTSQQTLINTIDTRETTHYNTLSTNITSVSNELYRYESAVDGRLHGIDNALDGHGSSINGLQNQVSTIIYVNMTQEEKIGNNTDDISELYGWRSGDRSDIDSLQNDNNTNKLNIATHTSQIAVLQQYDTANTTNITLLQNKTSTNEAEITNLKNTTIPNLDNKYLIKDSINGDSMLGKLKCNNLDVINNTDTLFIGENAPLIYLGSANNIDAKTINIGGVNDIINIKGTTNYMQVNNVQVENKLLTLNKGSVGNNTSNSVGIQIRDDDNDDKGYIKTNDTMDKFLLKAPQNETIYKIGAVDDINSLTTKSYVDLKDTDLQSQITNVLLIETQNSANISNINNQLLQNIPFSKINAYPSNINNLLDGTGNFVKVQNKHIDDASIDTKKLTGVDSLSTDDKFLNINGQFVSLYDHANNLTFNNTLTDDLNCNQNQINNMADGMFANDACTVGQMQLYVNDKTTGTNIISNITDYSLPLYKLQHMNGDGSYIILNSGTASKLNNNLIINGTIDPLKLSGTLSTNDGLSFLNNKGLWSTVNGFNNSFSANVDAKNFKITNLSNGVNSGDAVNKSQLDAQNTNLISYVDDKYFNQIAVSTYNSNQSGVGVPVMAYKFNILCNVDMLNNYIKNVADPVSAQDVSTKNYVDNKIITNSNLTNGSISVLKLAGISSTNNGTQYLNNKGEFVAVSSGSSKKSGSFGTTTVNTGIYIQGNSYVQITSIGYNFPLIAEIIIHDLMTSDGRLFSKFNYISGGYTSNNGSNVFLNYATDCTTIPWLTFSVINNILYLKYMNNYGNITFNYKEY